MLQVRFRSFLTLVLGMVFMSALPTAQAAELVVFISAFTKGSEAAIQSFRLNDTTGELQLLQKNTDVQNPFFLALSPNRKFLYSIHAAEFGGKDHEQVAAYEITSPDGQLKLLNRQSAHGTAACYLDVDPTGKTILVANYSTGTVASLPIKPDGSLDAAVSIFQHGDSSNIDARQKAARAHSFVFSPDNRFAFAADLGLDQVLSYQLDAAHAKLTPHKQPFVRTFAGAGPRHMTFDPQGKHLYVINELKGSVTMFDFIPESGTLIEQQTVSTLPKDYDGKSYCADVKITPNGKFLYGTNRGHDSIACYQIGDDGRLKLLAIEPSLGQGPQNLVITPNGGLLLCANMPGNNVSIFKINPETGALKSVGTPVSMVSPSCIRIK